LQNLSHILKSQCPSTFTIESRHREYFSECVECQTFSKVSALAHLLCETAIARTFENACRCRSLRRVNWGRLSSRASPSAPRRIVPQTAPRRTVCVCVCVCVGGWVGLCPNRAPPYCVCVCVKRCIVCVCVCVCVCIKRCNVQPHTSLRGVCRVSVSLCVSLSVWGGLHVRDACMCVYT